MNAVRIRCEAQTIPRSLARVLLVLCAGLFLLPPVSFAQSTLTLAWDPSTGAGVSGYRIYCGAASGAYSTTNQVGNTTSDTISGLSAGSTWYFAVSAVTANGLEGARSSELRYTVPQPPVTPPPVPPSSGLSFSADSGTITAPFAVSSGLLSQSISTGLTGSGRAVYSFTVPSTGDYMVSINVSTPDQAQNSVFINIDGEPTDPDMIWDVPVTVGFADQVVAWRGNGTPDIAQFAPKVFNLTQGTHQLIIRGREPNTVLGTITIRPLSTLPAPWQTSDIGAVATAGSASASGGLFNVTGAGNLGGTADAFRFVYQPMSGSGEMRARILSMRDTGTNGRAGVMIRESLTPGSKYVFLGISPDGTYQWQRRSTTSGSTGSATSSSSAGSNPWTRLVRSGSSFYGYKSSDGTNWTRVGSTKFSMSTNVFVGLAVGSGDTRVVNVSTFTNLLAVP
jgi:hypothetical protein